MISVFVFIFTSCNTLSCCSFSVKFVMIQLPNQVCLIQSALVWCFETCCNDRMFKLFKLFIIFAYTYTCKQLFTHQFWMMFTDSTNTRRSPCRDWLNARMLQPASHSFSPFSLPDYVLHPFVFHECLVVCTKQVGRDLCVSGSLRRIKGKV